jgi:hypothetical protein
MNSQQAMFDDVGITPYQANILSESESLEANDYQRSSSLVHWCMRNLPSPAPNYQFSVRQRIEQFAFLRDRMDLYLTRFLDLYNAAIVLARQYLCTYQCIDCLLLLLLVPTDSSDDMRHLIHALLVAYADPKLNVTEQACGATIKSRSIDGYWCQHLTHPRLRSTSLRCSSKDESISAR